MYDGHQLTDQNRLKDYGLPRVDCLHVVYLLCGGMQSGAHILPLIFTFGMGKTKVMGICQSRIPPKLALCLLLL